MEFRKRQNNTFGRSFFFYIGCEPKSNILNYESADPGDKTRRKIENNFSPTRVVSISLLFILYYIGTILRIYLGR